MPEVSLYIYTNIKTLNKKSTGAYIWLLETHVGQQPHTLVGKKEIEATWLEAELMAFISALGRINTKTDLTVFCGNLTIMNALQRGWLLSWKNNDFLNSKGQLLKAAELWAKLYEKLLAQDLKRITIEEHSYKSWMMCQLGEVTKKRQSEYSSQAKVISQIEEEMKGLDFSIISENGFLKSRILRLRDDLLENCKALKATQSEDLSESEVEEMQESSSAEHGTETAKPLITIH